MDWTFELFKQVAQNKACEFEGKEKYAEKNADESISNTNQMKFLHIFISKFHACIYSQKLLGFK